MTTDTLPGAGPELDKLVGEALGDPKRSYWDIEECSTYLPSAMQALEVWREQHPGWVARLELPAFAGNLYVVTLYEFAGDGIVSVQAPTHAEAVCQAIVLASREAK